MCGIAGFFGNLSNDKYQLVGMLDALHHRGPDQRFEYHADKFSMGMKKIFLIF